MKKIPLIILTLGGILFCIPFFVFGQEPASTLNTRTLKDLFAQALIHSERISLSQETVREAEALYRESLGNTLPFLSYRRAAQKEENSNLTQEGMFRVTKTGL